MDLWMRRAVFTLLLALAAAPTAAVAQLPAPPPIPTLPPLPLPLPQPLPEPPPPAPTLPSVPQATAVPQPTAVSTPPAVSAPQPAPPASTGQSQSGQSAGGASQTPQRSSGRKAAKRRPTVVLAFRSSTSGLVAIRLKQVAPVCRKAGRLLVPARTGPNRFRFTGRVSGHPLRDGTYVATTPSGAVRFAIVRGKPTRSAKRLSPSVCDARAVDGTSIAIGNPLSDKPTRTAAAPTPNTDSGATDEPGPIPRVLGTVFTEAGEAAASLHPAFYVLLGLAMVALAAAAVPARTLPAATAGAVLARHRAAVTFAGTLCLLFVIVVYWATLL